MAGSLRRPEFYRETLALSVLHPPVGLQPGSFRGAEENPITKRCLEAALRQSWWTVRGFGASEAQKGSLPLQ